MKISAIFFTILTVAITATAQYSSGPNVLNVVCNDNVMGVEQYDSTGNLKSNVSYNMPGYHACHNARGLILRLTNYGQLQRETTIAFCNDTSLMKLRLGANSVSTVGNTPMTGYYACMSAADQFNMLFNN